MKRLTVSFVAALSLLMLLSAAPALADMAKAGTGAVNTVVNTAFGWVECPKAAWNEVTKAPSRGYVGVVITAPVMCGFNVGVRYVGNAVDWIKLPVSWLDGLERNTVNPAIYEKLEPAYPLP